VQLTKKQLFIIVGVGLITSGVFTIALIIKILPWFCSSSKVAV